MAPSSYNCFTELSCCVCKCLQDSVRNLHYHQTYSHSTQELSLALISLKGWDLMPEAIISDSLRDCGQVSQRASNVSQVHFEVVNDDKNVNSYPSTSQGKQIIPLCKVEGIESLSVRSDGLLYHPKESKEMEKCTLNDTLNSVKISNDILINGLDKTPPSKLNLASHHVSYCEKTPPQERCINSSDINLDSNEIISDSETETDIEVQANEKLFDSDCEIKMDVFDLYNTYKNSFPLGESINLKNDEVVNTEGVLNKNYFEGEKLKSQTAETSTLLCGMEMVCIEDQNSVGDLKMVPPNINGQSLVSKMKEETFSSSSSDSLLSPTKPSDSQNHFSNLNVVSGVMSRDLITDSTNNITDDNIVLPISSHNLHNRNLSYDFPSPILCSDAKSLDRDPDFVDFFLSPVNIDIENCSEKYDSPSTRLSNNIQSKVEMINMRESSVTKLPSLKESTVMKEVHKTSFHKMKSTAGCIKNNSQKNIYPDDSKVEMSSSAVIPKPPSKAKSIGCSGGFYKAKTEPALLTDLNVPKVSERRFFCESCGKGYKKKSHLERHLRVHTGERPFPCPYCTKRFAVRSILKQHIRIHTGEKPYSCNICSQRFPQKSGLMTHMMLHTGKPFKCDVCEKSFVSNHKLLQHLKGHDTQQTCYSCKSCKMEFFTVGALAVHEKVHENNFKYKCPNCEESFTQASNLEIHLEKHKINTS